VDSCIQDWRIEGRWVLSLCCSAGEVVEALVPAVVQEDRIRYIQAC
jgi:hypothetical protein